MMMVVTVMAVILHLIKNLRVDPRGCQPATVVSGKELSILGRIRRHGEDVSMEVLRRRGEIQVSIVLAH